MKKFNFSQLPLIIAIIFTTAVFSCQTPTNNPESESKTIVETEQAKRTESIPDSVVQYLTASAAQDFNDHTPPTAIDFRNVKAGYVGSDTSLLYLICGEFLTQEKNEWVMFTTIKTSKYEQYIGETMYCQKATLINDGSEKLSQEIKAKLMELKK